MKRLLWSIFGAFVCLSIQSSAWGEKYRLGDVDQEPSLEKKKNYEETHRTPEEQKRLVDQVSQQFYDEAILALREGNLNKAEALFDRVLKLNPNHKRAQEGIGLIMQLQEDRPSRTTSSKKKAKKKNDPKTTLTKKFWEDLKRAEKKRDWEQVKSVAGQILAINPDDIKAQAKYDLANEKLFSIYKGRGLGEEKAGQKQKAIRFYKKALSFKDDPALQKRIHSLEKIVVTLNAEKSEELYIEALKASQNGNLEIAVELCEKALRLNPKNLQAKRMLQRLR